MSLQSENSSYCVLIQCFRRLGFIGLFYKKENIVLTAKEKKYIRYQNASSICIITFEISIISLGFIYSLMNFNENVESNNYYEILKVGNVLYFVFPNNLINWFIITNASLIAINW